MIGGSHPHFIGVALSLGLLDLDAAALKDARPRRLTQAIAAGIFETTDLDGVTFSSRHDDDLKLWAIFEVQKERNMRPHAAGCDHEFDRAAASFVAPSNGLAISSCNRGNVYQAGAPWCMTLFGRDSLWASIMSMPVDPSLALGTVQTLAEHQGIAVDPTSEEEPGKILHEVRFGVTSGLALGGQHAYYGSIDATLLFLIVLSEMSRWGFSPEVTSALLPNADAALGWIRDYGDKDGDGFVEYARLNNRGLINQGWKDSWDGINFADGTLAQPPIALCEVQGYLYGAYIWQAWMAFQQGDTVLAAGLRSRAERLKGEFNDKFWLPERGYYAVALDRDKKPVDACASNMGHYLWTGIVDEDKAPLVVKRLMSPQMFSGWGIRTLASDMGAYNPVSYHNGSVWPHDNAIIAAGLKRYGFVEEAQRISTALFEAADHSNVRLPELFCGFDRSRLLAPVPYPTACSPQAWAATTPIFLVTNLMRYYPHVALGGLWMDPVSPNLMATCI